MASSGHHDQNEVKVNIINHFLLKELHIFYNEIFTVCSNVVCHLKGFESEAHCNQKKNHYIIGSMMVVAN